ncbi:putative calcineurin-like phosphoesterase [Plectosphaerella plurivora]|uniref:Calcineurin-like phosphoesterase n=1 Tax=Plectosphaerella plurivora TaxID=936078 RepID=A0A9P9ABL7_9PEZI|nr:putative calcineurin-like phosphoesterase [Plectosphaerella plurivora]
MDLSKALRRIIGSPRPRIQVLSDLHLEVGQQYTSFADSFRATAPFLVLAGDVGRVIDEDYLRFLKVQTSRYQNVFLVLGNHEFYGLDHDSAVAQAKRLVQDPTLDGKVVLLHRTRWDDPDSDLTILGCTLWSVIPEDIFDIIKAKVKDYQRIEGWTPQHHNAAHAEDVTWLRQQVSKAAAEKRRIMVVTHHAPCVKGASHPKYENNPWTPAFATDLLHQGTWRAVKVWVFGHTHFSTEFVHEGTRVVSNQRGYALSGSLEKESEKEKEDGEGRSFDASLAISV